MSAVSIVDTNEVDIGESSSSSADEDICSDEDMAALADRTTEANAHLQSHPLGPGYAHDKDIPGDGNKAKAKKKHQGKKKRERLLLVSGDAQLLGGPDNKNRQYPRITILFDLNGVLIKARAPKPGVSKLHAFDARPGLRHLVSLLPHFRLGLYTSATEYTATTRLRSIMNHLWEDGVIKVLLDTWGYKRDVLSGENSVFQVVFHRGHCRPDSTWSSRPDGNEWDTVKPLAEHGFDLTQTILVDDSARKFLSNERGCHVLLPTFGGPGGRTEEEESHDNVNLSEGRVPLFRVLCLALLETLPQCAADVRFAVPHIQGVLDDMVALKRTDLLSTLEQHPSCPAHSEVASVFSSSTAIPSLPPLLPELYVSANAAA